MLPPHPQTNVIVWVASHAHYPNDSVDYSIIEKLDQTFWPTIGAVGQHESWLDYAFWAIIGASGPSWQWTKLGQAFWIIIGMLGWPDSGLN